jgi:hypothetical protein
VKFRPLHDRIVMDRFENMGAQMVHEVASKTSDIAGDGTNLDSAGSFHREGRGETVGRRHEPDGQRSCAPRRPSRVSPLAIGRGPTHTSLTAQNMITGLED